MATKSLRKKSIYKRRLYWYHVSTTLKDKHVRLTPWDEDKGFNRGGYEPDGKRICVAPSVEQCITAVPYILETKFNIYRTKSKLRADRPKDVFDSKVTHEGWLHKPTQFVKIGILSFRDVEKGLGVNHVIEQAASLCEPRQSGKVLKWWKRARIQRFVKRA